MSEKERGAKGKRTQLRPRDKERLNSSNQSLSVASFFSQDQDQSQPEKKKNHDRNSSQWSGLEIDGEASFQVITDASSAQLAFVSAIRRANGGSFTKPYRKGGSERYEQAKRRTGRSRRAEQIGQRNSRKTDIFASLDREEEAGKMHAGALMRRGLARAKSREGLRQLMMAKGTPNVQDNADHCCSRSNLGADEDESAVKGVWQKRKEVNEQQIAELENGISNFG
jgi:hypothetical protein